ncbi:MAG: 16S rRNA (guanine(527)-N(7))-methyltransferase RsmG [Bacilli bacterium]|nr:16S rRNA (guanine(527)-N(7))-methyltransferase RsmG [Bacilli bacterium]
MDKEEFINAIKDLSINIDEKQLSQLNEYYNMLIEYNKHTNLTRITEEKEVYLKHFYDSLTICKVINLNSQSLLDIGTGAGFPGLVLKILFPNLKVTLVDSLNKRIIFLNQVINKLGLKEIRALHKRAEEYAKDNKEKFDIVTSRAVANLNILSELCIPYVKIGGYFIPMKADAKEEINSSINAIKTLGCVLEKTLIFNLPKEKSIRTLIMIKKEASTNSKYPRKYNEIKKKPL